MDITSVVMKLTPEEFDMVKAASKPVESVFFDLARSGVQVYSSEMCPPSAMVFVNVERDGRKDENGMTKIDKGVLEVGTNDNGEVIINHPDLTPDEDGVGHIVFSVDQAMNLSRLLSQKAGEAALVNHRKKELARIASLPPVDRSARVLASGQPVPEDQSHTQLRSDGQQEGYVVLTESERGKGFVRPYRDAYRHLKCGKITTMGRSIAETYARDPNFYTATFCSACGAHFPIGESGEFTWYEMDGSTGPKVGT